MNRIKKTFVLLFFLFLIIPVVQLNVEKDVVSEIDNRMLAPEPIVAIKKGELPNQAIEQYISDRIGYRQEMIFAYTIANDFLFHEMIHPSYIYGKEDYVFFKPTKNKTYGEFEECFADMVINIQKYCNERNVPFVFVFEPSKATILKDNLPDGYNYNNEWVDLFISKLKKNGINVVDNTETMLNCYEKGISSFNIKYDAGHWNDNGAFYGMNAILNNLSQNGAKVHVNKKEEYNVKSRLNTALPASQFPIHEYEPCFTQKKENEIVDITDMYKKEIQLNKDYSEFFYLKNSERIKNGEAKALVFQGSYINGRGKLFLKNGFGEYIAVHDYQNILDFDYYVNVFQPDCIIFEVAEYTINDTYFSLEGMKEFKLNPSYDVFRNNKQQDLNGNLVIIKDEMTSTLKLENPSELGDYVYLKNNGKTFDMRIVENETSKKPHYEVTVSNDCFDFNSKIEIIAVSKEKESNYVFDRS